MPSLEHPENKPFESEQKLPSEFEVDSFLGPLEEFSREKWDEKNHRAFLIFEQSMKDLLASEKRGGSEGLKIALEDAAHHYLYSPSELQQGIIKSFGLVHGAIVQEGGSDLTRVKVNACLSMFGTATTELNKAELFTKVLTPQDRKDLFLLYELINGYMASDPVEPKEAAQNLIRQARAKLQISQNNIKRYSQLDDRVKFYFEPNPEEVTGSVTRNHRVMPKEIKELRQKEGEPFKPFEKPTPEAVEDLHQQILEEYTKIDIREHFQKEKQN